MALTSGIKLEVRRGNTGPYTTFTDDVHGVGSLNFNPNQRASRQIPNTSRIVATQLLQYKTGNLSFTCDANSVTQPLFFMRSGEEFSYRYTREDGKSATPVHTGRGIATVNYNSAVRGVRTIQVSIAITHNAESVV